MRILKIGYHYSNGHPVCTVEHFANIFTAWGTISHVILLFEKKKEMQVAS